MKYTRHWYRTVYLHSEHWLELKASKLATSPACEHCEGAGPYDVHHNRYRNLYDCTIADLETLCRKCHEQRHLKKEQTSKPGTSAPFNAHERHEKWLASRLLGNRTGKFPDPAKKFAMEAVTPKIKY